MRTHNMHFCGEIRKYQYTLVVKASLISRSVRHIKTLIILTGLKPTPCQL